MFKQLPNSIYYLLDHHMLIFIPGVFTHLLDIGINHEPCCHIVTTSIVTSENELRLVPLCCENNTTINLNTLDIIPITIPVSNLIDTFKSDTTLDNKISILHYLIVHRNDFDTVGEVIKIKPPTIQLIFEIKLF